MTFYEAYGLCQHGQAIVSPLTGERIEKWCDTVSTFMLNNADTVGEAALAASDWELESGSPE